MTSAGHSHVQPVQGRITEGPKPWPEVTSGGGAWLGARDEEWYRETWRNISQTTVLDEQLECSELEHPLPASADLLLWLEVQLLVESHQHERPPRTSCFTLR